MGLRTHRVRRGMAAKIAHQIKNPLGIINIATVQRFSAMRWTVVERIIWAWLFTLPASGLIGYTLSRAAATL